MNKTYKAVISTLAVLVVVLLSIVSEKELLNTMALLTVIIYIPIISILVSSKKDRYKTGKKTYKINYNDIRKTEKEITGIILSFMYLKKFDNIKCLEILGEVFDTYSEKLLVNVSDLELKYIIERYSENQNNLDKACKYISGMKTKLRLFVLYSLLDIAAYDNLYSEEEENFIDQIRIKLKIPLNTFNVVKRIYSDKGLQDERMIIEEQNRKKIAQSFLPYNAYKVLGVTPSVTKSQLKNIYRKLAKKFHPDKYYGQSEETIQKAEDKFQEVTKAFEIIVKFKKF